MTSRQHFLASWPFLKIHLCILSIFRMISIRHRSFRLQSIVLLLLMFSLLSVCSCAICCLSTSIFSKSLFSKRLCCRSGDAGIPRACNLVQQEQRCFQHADLCHFPV
ncbi:hypothetical protein EDB82DRAFT_495165 [Fusarium venenatum]|uniref:uncharacterized protein n=1 Tax=Fusarium venenatum TaxID=56646 RepID=UPI001D664975|nr:hypothetical protein EDB82DRAFT_495165 [Fusarium venenatum]